MGKGKLKKKQIENTISNHQQFFNRLIVAVLVDLVVLGLFNEFWELVVIDLFSIALVAALLLQVLLKLTLVIEHKVAAYFNKKSGVMPKVMRFVSAWAILFVSKLLILEVINYAFGEHVQFLGPWHGVVAFIVVVIGILVAEGIVRKIYKALA
ncbi:hypothetical protein O3Q51_14545 [Cryomorphaceae bacterium 1068]|nr:hypothetical protein [Cryomorphaceae bacterium 1068]